MNIGISILRGAIGIAVLLLIAFLASNNRKKIKWRIVMAGLLINVILINFILHTILGQGIFKYAAKFIDKFMSYAVYGSSFVFGTIQTGNPFAFFFIALIPLIFVGAIMGILYHLGIVQRVLKLISYFLIKVFKLSGIEAFGICSNVFVGQTETAVVMSPYFPKMSQAELFMVMVSGMSSVAGTLLYAYQKMGANLSYVIAASILSAPSAVIMAKIIFPETESEKELLRNDVDKIDLGTKNIFDAISHGAMGGWKIALGVGVMLVAFIPLIRIIDSLVCLVSFHYLTFNHLLGYLFTPVAFIIGVPKSDVTSFATLLGQKTLFNEFIAYSNLAKIHLSHKGFLMVCFALTGFANLGSIAIQIGGYGASDDNVRTKVAKFGLKALLAAVLANLVSATMAGMFFWK